MTAPKIASIRQSHRSGFSLVEILVVCTVIAILALVLIPMATSMRSRAKSAQCQANLRQIGVLAQLYSSDNQGDILPMYYPNDDPNPFSMKHWTGLLAPYLNHDRDEGPYDSFESQPLFVCPSQPGIFGYGLNYDAISPFTPGLSSGAKVLVKKQFVILDPASTVFMADVDVSSGTWHPYLRPPKMWEKLNAGVDFRHDGKTANVLWLDGHVSSETYDSLSDPSLWDAQ